MQSDLYSLTNKVAIVTGGAKNLGLCITRTLLEKGMRVAICGRNQEDLSASLDLLAKDYGNKVWGMACDVSKSKEVERFYIEIEKQFGDVHILVNNSGFGKETLIWKTSEDDWDDVMNTNVKGAFLMSKAVSPTMIKNKEGYIVNIASQAALNGYANAGVYCASKFAMLGLGKALQEELHPYNVHVHSLNPALIQSKRKKEEALDPSLLQNEDIAQMLTYLIQQPRRIKIDNVGLWGF